MVSIPASSGCRTVFSWSEAGGEWVMLFMLAIIDSSLAPLSLPMVPAFDVVVGSYV